MKGHPKVAATATPRPDVHIAVSRIQDAVADRVAARELDAFVRTGRWYAGQMRVDFDLDIDVRCVSCGAERELPEGTATRVLEGDALYAETRDECEACGAKRIRVDVKINEEANEGDG